MACCVLRNKGRRATAQHPGHVLRERFLEPLNISPIDLARGVGVNRSAVSRLLAGEQPLTPAMAARLGSFFGVPARWFVMMQAEYDAEMVTGDPSWSEGVTPWAPDPNVMLTPRGVLELDDSGSEPEPIGEAVSVRRLPNGAVILEGGRA